MFKTYMTKIIKCKSISEILDKYIHSFGSKDSSSTKMLVRSEFIHLMQPPIKTLSCFVVDPDNLIIKFIWKTKNILENPEN